MPETEEVMLLEDMEREGFLALSAKTDPVLWELWDNELDAAYDRLPDPAE